jgi:spermidine/putrescine-binding protein
MQPTDRRQFLRSAAVIAGAGWLSACGGSGRSGSGIAGESGHLSILEWGGYEAHGTPAQNRGLLAGADYTRRFGADGLAYTYIVNDDQALSRATHTAFDIMHPCHQNLADYVGRGICQPWDTSLLPSFRNLDPVLAARGRAQGPDDASPKQYMIPWDWGFASLLYRRDRVRAADATGWELVWNPRYSGRIALSGGSTANMEMAALKLGYPRPDVMTPAQIAAAQEALIQQKPYTRFYWSSEYSELEPAFRAGDVWIAYSWQDVLVAMARAGLDVAFMQPRQGRIMWLCGFVLGRRTQEYYHAHAYVESFINHRACVQMTNLYDYGTADGTITPAEIDDPVLAKVLEIGRPRALASPSIHLQDWQPSRLAYEQAWALVEAAVV